MGPPGSGKGTQANFLKEKLGLEHISTGEILREELEARSDLGLKAKGYMEEGKLLPDEIIIEILKKRLSKEDCEGGFLLDGFPRTLVQAYELDRILKEGGKGLDCVIQIEVRFEELSKRLCLRRVQEGRNDDDEKTIQKRLKTYEEEKFPLIDYYKAKGLIWKVDGFGTVEEVQGRIFERLEGESEIVMNPSTVKEE